MSQTYTGEEDTRKGVKADDVEDVSAVEDTSGCSEGDKKRHVPKGEHNQNTEPHPNPNLHSIDLTLILMPP